MAVGVFGIGVIFTLFLSGLLSSPERAIVRRLCETRPLVYLGRISYGFYVLHMPVVTSLRKDWPSADGFLADCLGVFTTAMLTSTALATLGWFGSERPLLHLRRD